MKKLNRKGFTLVELLAVIVILAILALVAVNNVLPKMQEARSNSFKTEALNFLKVAEEDYASNPMSAGDYNKSIREIVAEGLMKKADIKNYTGCVKYDSSNKKWTIKMATAQYMTDGYVTSAELADFNGKIEDSGANKTKILTSTGIANINLTSDPFGSECPE